MNKKKLISIIASVVVVLAMAGVGTWMFLQRSAEETGGNKLGVEWYDVNGTEFVITTADELFELSELSNYYDFKNQTIKLGADIVVNEGNVEDWEKKAPSRKWSPINGFGGEFDGQGHTISGLYAKGYDAAVALFSNTMSGAVIQDFKLTNSYFESAGFGGVASISSNGGGKFKKIYSDAILNVVGTYSGFAGGICSKLNLQSSLEECWFDGVINTTGRDCGGILDDVMGSRVTISHCLFSGEINSTWDFSGGRTGGIVGRIAEEGAGLVLTDCLSTGAINASTIYYTGSVIGTTTKNTSLTTTNSYGSMGSYDVAIGRSGLSGTINSYPIELYARELVGTKAYQWTNLDFNKYWTIIEDETPILQCFAEKVPSVAGLEKAFDTSWYTEGASEYVITDRADLYGFYMLSASNTFTGKTIKLGADIVINDGNAKDWAKVEPENVWYPIMKFAGTFDGQGYTVSGLYLSTAAEKAGFFKETMSTAVVKNMTLKNSYMISTTTANAFLGSICGRGGGTFDAIYSDAIMVSHGSIVGGIFAQVNLEAKNSFTNCWFDGAITMKGETARYVGGVVGGVVKGNTTIAHCLNTGAISQLDFKDAGMFVGGIVGYIINDKTVGTISDCLNTGKISVNYHVCVGSVVGRLNQAVVTISDTYATNESYTYEDGKFRGIGTSSKGYTGGVSNFPESYLSGMGGYQWSTLNFKDYWTVVTGPDSTPILKVFANKVPSVAGVARKIDTSWYSADKKSFVLKDLEDLYGFYAVSCFDTFYEDTVNLGADIVVNEGNATEWAQVAPTNPWFTIHSFKGTFDGQGHTISGVYLKTDETYSGFFSKTTKESTIKNFKLTNSYFENTIADEMAAFGSVAGQMGGVIDTVYSDAIVVGKGTQIGGLAGRINHGALEKYTMTNCWFNGSVKVHNTTATTAYIGGLSGGLIQGYLDMNNCLNSGTVTYTFDKLPLQKDGSTHYIGTHVGGLLGGVMNGTAYNKDKTLKRVSEWNATDSLNSGLVSAGMADGSKMNGETFANGAGSILGYTTSGTVNLKNVYATTESCTKRTMSKGKKAVVSGSVMKVSEELISGVKGYQLTDLDFNKYWAALVNPDETPVLKSFVNGANLDGVKKLADFTWYDADAKSYTLDSAEDLYGFAMISLVDNFNSKTVKLGANITLNEGDASTWGTSAPANEWIPISSFAGTFDGNGKTISGLYLKTEDSYAGLFSKTTNASTVKNLSIKNSYFESKNSDMAAIGSVAGQMGGTLDTVYSDAIVVAAGTQVGGLVGRANQSKTSEYTITDCWFNGSVTVTDDIAQMAYIGGLVGTNVQGVLKIDNCLNTGTVSYMYDELPLDEDGEIWGIGVHVGGLVGGVMNGVRKDTQKGIISEVYITDCMNGKQVVSGLKDGSKAANGAGSIFGYTTEGKVVMNTVYAVNYSDANTYVITTTYARNDKKATVEGKVTKLDREFLIGTRGYTYTTLDFNEHWKARISEIPAIKAFVTDKVDMSVAWRPDTSWYNDNDTQFEIDTVEKFYGFAQLVNDGNDFAGKTITVTAEEELNLNPGWEAGTTEPENLWVPIGTEKTPFKGDFNGNNKVISGIYVDWNNTEVSNGLVGLFGYAIDGTIANFTLSNSYFKGDAYAMGAVVGNGDGNLERIYVDNTVTINTACTVVGGIIGRVQDRKNTSYAANTQLLVSNCWFDGTIIQEFTGDASTQSGGIVGYIVHGSQQSVIDNCLFTGSITNTLNYTGTKNNRHAITGGLFARNNSNCNILISNSLSAGSMIVSATNTTQNVGSVVGYAESNSTEVCQNVYGTTTAFGYTKNGLKASVLPESNLLGIKGYRFTMLDFDPQNGSWSAREGKVPALRAFVETGLPLTGVRINTSWYDGENAPEGNVVDPYLISNVSDLYGFAYLVNNGNTFKGKVVKLADDITVLDLNEGWTAGATEPENVWIPIGSCTNLNDKTGNYFAGTFDGNNKTIKGLYVNVIDASAGLFGFTVDSTIRNLRIKNSYMTSEFGVLGSVIGYGEGLIYNVYSEASLVSNASQVGGLIGHVQDATVDGSTNSKTQTNCNIINCEYSGDITVSDVEKASSGGLVGAAIYGTTNIYNCIAKADILCSSVVTRVGGLIGQNNGTNTIISVRNCVIAGSLNGGSKNGSVIGYVSGADVTIDDSVFVSAEYTQEVCGSIAKNVSGYTINPTQVDFSDSNAVSTAISKLNANVALNNNNSVNVTWNTWNQENGVPVFGEAPVGDIIDVTADTTWEGEGTLAKPYIISTPGELYGLAQEVNNGNSFTGKYFELANDVEINKGSATEWANGSSVPVNVWTPIGDGVDSFQGTFDGKGNTISGLYLDTNRNYVGLFGYTIDSTIKNLRLTNSYFKTTAKTNLGVKSVNNYALMGSFVGHGEGVFENLYSEAILEAPSGHEKDYGGQIGGIIGRVQHALSATKADTSCTITNCWFAGKIITNITERAYTGGLVGMQVYGDLSISNSLMSGDIVCSGTEKRLGGILGNDNGNNTATTIKNCVMAGTITGGTSVGSLTGKVSATTNADDSVFVQSGICSKLESEGTSTNIKSAQVVDLKNASVVSDTMSVLNNHATANSSWCNWILNNGKLALEQLIK